MRLRIGGGRAMIYRSYQMRKIMLPLAISVALLLMGLWSSAAQAQATRTWVSGVGDDVNPCSRTAPCKTWAGAISKTAAGGEIDALDPAGYGAVTVTKSIILDGGGVGMVSSLVAGINGIVVQAGPSDVVTIRNVTINGIGTGLNGIRFLAGKALHVENVVIENFTQKGIDATTASGDNGLFVRDTEIRSTMGGIYVHPTSPSTLSAS